VDNANHFYTVMEHVKNFQVLSNFYKNIQLYEIKTHYNFIHE